MRLVQLGEWRKADCSRIYLIRGPVLRTVAIYVVCTYFKGHVNNCFVRRDFTTWKMSRDEMSVRGWASTADEAFMMNSEEWWAMMDDEGGDWSNVPVIAEQEPSSSPPPQSPDGRTLVQGDPVRGGKASSSGK